MPPSDSGDRRVEALPIVGGVRLESLRVDNLRAIRMDEPVELRRLMLVVGRNGVGKSTLARLFPLLRQSLGKRAREPLLWWDEQGVDFGSFGEALRHGAEELTLGFGFQGIDGLTSVTTTLGASLGPAIDMEGAKSDTRMCRVRSARVENAEGSIQFVLSESGLIAKLVARVGVDDLTQSSDASGEDVLVASQLGWSPGLLFGREPDSDGLDAMYRVTRDLFRGVGSESQRRDTLRRIVWHRPDGVVRALREADLGSEFQHRVDLFSADSDAIKRLRFARLALWGSRVLRGCQEQISKLADRSAYIGPFRGMPIRGYRPSSVEVEQLDPQGTSLSMFLSALKDQERVELNEFLCDKLNFRVHVRATGAQVEVQVELEGRRYNLVDVGFGYSQVLPVVVQLWAAGRVLSFSRKKKPLATLVIEQPELHLHPHHQVLVARALAASAMEDQGPMLMIETHSDHLVGEVGLQVARGELEPERVGVLCVEPHPVAGATVRLATFDADGVLHNWPTGFLAP